MHPLPPGSIAFDSSAGSVGGFFLTEGVYVGDFLAIAALTSNPDRSWEWAGRPFDPVFAGFGTIRVTFPIDADLDRIVAAGGLPDAGSCSGLGAAIFLAARAIMSARIVALAFADDAINAP